MIYAKGKITYNDGMIKEFQVECESLEKGVELFNQYSSEENVKLFNFTLNYRR